MCSLSMPFIFYPPLILITAIAIPSFPMKAPQLSSQYLNSIEFAFFSSLSQCLFTCFFNQICQLSLCLFTSQLLLGSLQCSFISQFIKTQALKYSILQFISIVPSHQNYKQYLSGSISSGIISAHWAREFFLEPIPQTFYMKRMSAQKFINFFIFLKLSQANGTRLFFPSCIDSVLLHIHQNFIHIFTVVPLLYVKYAGQYDTEQAENPQVNVELIVKVVVTDHCEFMVRCVELLKTYVLCFMTQYPVQFNSCEDEKVYGCERSHPFQAIDRLFMSPKQKPVNQHRQTEQVLNCKESVDVHTKTQIKQITCTGSCQGNYQKVNNLSELHYVIINEKSCISKPCSIVSEILLITASPLLSCLARRPNKIGQIRLIQFCFYFYYQMESGTRLHIALLRKTSTAKKKQRAKQQRSSLLPICEDNYTLSGWSTDERQFREECQRSLYKKHSDKAAIIKRENQAKNSALSIVNRNKLFSSEQPYRSKIRSFSQRVYQQNNSLKDKFKANAQQNHGSANFLNFNPNLNENCEFAKLNISYSEQQKPEAKENNGNLDIQRLMTLMRHRQRPDKKILNDKKTFANFINLNLNNVRARKFFKLQA